MSLSDGLDSSTLCRELENLRPIREKMESKVFIYSQSWHFSFVKHVIEVLFATLYIDLTFEHLRFRTRERYKKENWTDQ